MLKAQQFHSKPSMETITFEKLALFPTAKL